MADLADAGHGGRLRPADPADLRAGVSAGARAALALRPCTTLPRGRGRSFLALALSADSERGRARRAPRRIAAAGTHRGVPALQLRDGDRRAGLGHSMSALGVLSQAMEIAVALALAPLLTGWVNQCRAWLQNKSAPPLLQPYRLLHKLFHKDSVVAEPASPLFRAAPYLVFGCMTLACAIVPTVSTELPLSPAADAIALVGLFALARVFISLAA